MTKTHKYDNKPTIKNLETMVLSNPDDDVESGFGGWSAADVNERESLEETAIVERLRRFNVLENSHVGFGALDMPSTDCTQFQRSESLGTQFKRLKINGKNARYFWNTILAINRNQMFRMARFEQYEYKTAS